MRTDPVVRAAVTAAVRSVDPRVREVVHLISTPSTDRGGDVVEPLGADISDYLRNPIVIANHSYQIQDVIGRAVDLSVRSDGIVARTRFLDTPLAQAAYQLASEGIGGWSIGFRPLEWKDLPEGGRRYTRWSLLEYSSVAIPMNQDVVNNAVARGLVSRADVSRFFLPSPGGLVSFPSPGRRARRGEWSEADKRAFARAVREVRAEIARTIAKLKREDRSLYDRD